MRKATQTPPPSLGTSSAANVADDLYYDEDETDCPLCLEEMADSDRLFKPCPCGYQVRVYLLNFFRFVGFVIIGSGRRLMESVRLVVGNIWLRTR